MHAALKALAVLAALLTLAPSAAAQPSLFGSVELRAGSIGAIPQWQRVLDQIEREHPVYRACRRDPAMCPARSVRAWQTMILRQAGRPAREQVESINTFLNNWRYRTDSNNYGQRDYWASPMEFLTRSGDCEDYAIAKYVSLRQLGFAPDQLRLVVLQDLQRNLAHAVLAVYLEQEVLILDNLNRNVLRHDELPHYVPYYSINEAARWAHVAPAAPATAVAARETGDPVAPASTPAPKDAAGAAPSS